LPSDSKCGTLKEGCPHLVKPVSMAEFSTELPDSQVQAQTVLSLLVLLQVDTLAVAMAMAGLGADALDAFKRFAQKYIGLP